MFPRGSQFQVSSISGELQHNLYRISRDVVWFYLGDRSNYVERCSVTRPGSLMEMFGSRTIFESFNLHQLSPSIRIYMRNTIVVWQYDVLLPVMISRGYMLVPRNYNARYQCIHVTLNVNKQDWHICAAKSML